MGMLQKFNATLGYPGEGPPCGICKQEHRSEERMMACKHLRWCKTCDSTFNNIQNHMMTIHHGWTCAKSCDKRHSSKQMRNGCKCSECPHCHFYFHNMRIHNNEKHDGKQTEQQRQDRRQRNKKSDRKRRREFTPEQKERANKVHRERMKESREAEKTLEEKYPCVKNCGKKFVHKGYAKHCACKECKHCGKFERDVKTHIRLKHPEHYVKDKLDVYKELRRRCWQGVQELQAEIEAAARRDPTLEEIDTDYKERRGKAVPKHKSLNVRITAKILNKKLDDPLLEGLDTWNGELFEKQGQQCRDVDIQTGLFKDGYLPDTKDNVPYHQKRMMRIRDAAYKTFQMRTCDVCCERRWWQNKIEWWRNKAETKSIPQRYIKPLDEDNMFPNDSQKQKLQEEFDDLNFSNGKPTYKLCDRALEAAHRVKLTDTTGYTCSLCSDNKKHKQTQYERWEIFNRFNMMIPSPAPRVLQRLNPVEVLMVPRSAVVMTIHNRLHDTNRKQSRSTGHGCVVQMDHAAQIQSIRYKLPRGRDDINAWQVVREDGDNKPYKVPINIEHILDALDWLIKNNALYEDLKDTDWKNEAAIEDYRKNKIFVIEQHIPKAQSKGEEQKQEYADVEHQADDVEQGYEQPGLDDNEKNRPALTPSFDIGEGEHVCCDEAVYTHRCPYNPTGSKCLNPDECLCRQVHKGVPDLLDKTGAERWLSAISGNEVDEARRAASEIITNHQRKNTCEIHLSNADAKPQNEWSEKDILAMAFVAEFPFGITSFRTPRHVPSTDIIDWTRHLAYLCYKLDDDSATVQHRFQVNPAFVLYIRNRAHRHAINNDLKFFLQRTTKQLKKKFPRWNDNITNAEFRKWPKEELTKFHTYVASNLECKPGDPADLQKFKKTLISCTLAHGTPTDYVTTSWNDPNVWDLHRPEILPYPEDPNTHQTQIPKPPAPRKSSQYQIHQDAMTSHKPELQNTTDASRTAQIYPKEMRYKMLHENPATVCMWFFIRQLVNMEVMQRSSYPVAYEKWYARKFEFQDRGSVHEHAVKALTFLWIMSHAHEKKKKAEELTEDDFEEITCRTDKLSMYCESAKVREIMVGRIAYRISQYLKEDDLSTKKRDNLLVLQAQFKKFQNWMTCSCKNDSSRKEGHMCADEELSLIALAMKDNKTAPEPTTFEQPSLADLPPTQNNTIDSESLERDEFADDAFKHFRHVTVEYDDPTLKELCRWTSDEGKQEVTDMLASYREWILLGRHAEHMLIAFANARIHAYDNTQTNYPARSAEQGRYKHGRQDVANRITRLRQDDTNAHTPCNVTLYEDCHRLHVATSQLHECSKCCIRYKTKTSKTPSSCIPCSLDPADATKQVNTAEKHVLIRVCRFRAPWLERMCKVCFKDNKSVRWDVCENCFKDKAELTGLEQHVPYRPQLTTEVKYAKRYDRANHFHSARPEISVRRNNPWVTTHNRDATLVNGGNTDLQLTFHIGRIISYLYSYLAKKEVTKTEVVRHLNSSLRALSDVLESSYMVTLQRAVSAAIAGRTFSTQAAWWQILGLPICDTNIIRDSVFINSRKKQLNLKQFNSKGEQSLTRKDYYEAYAQRSKMVNENDPGLCAIVKEYSLEQFVEKCYHQTRKGKLFVATRVLKHKRYSKHDPVLQFADKTYPFVHMVQFPELFDKRLKNGDPKGDMYWCWCQLQLTIHKPWHLNPLKLWGDGFRSMDEIPKRVFIKKWLEFVGTTEIGQEVQNRFDRHRTERTACKDGLLDLDKYAEQGWDADPDYCFGNTVGDVTASGLTRAEEILRAGRDWDAELKARNEARKKYTDEEVEQSISWIAKQKKKQKQLTMRDFGRVDTLKLDDEQRIMWVILQLACRDELIIKGEKRQVFMHMRGKPGTGKSEVLKCAQTDELFQKHARLAATTGSAGCLIGGSTIHSLVLLPFQYSRRGPLDGTDKHNVEQRLLDVRVLIIDEKSMLSQENLGWLDMRLKAVQPDKTKKSLPFGGYHIFFFGDIRQIQPVAARVMHSKKDVDPDEKWATKIQLGKDMYQEIKYAFELKTNHRIKEDTDELTKQFIEEMHKIGDGTCSASDWEFWQQFMDHLDPEASEKFANDPETTFLFPTNLQAATVNSDYVNSTKDATVLFQWPAENTGRARRAPLGDVNMLRPYVGVREGSNVMVLVNLWQPAGICNGGRGIVRDVVFERGSTQESLPKFVVVEIPAYTGPPFPKWSNDPKKAKWVPIPVYVSTMSTPKGEQSRSARRQIPIALTRALTHHKAQGMSLDKIYIKLYNTSSRGVTRLHNNFGILYTALSRAKKPNTNVLIEHFKPEVLDAISGSDAMKAMRAEFVNLEKKAMETEEWARPMLKEFNRLFNEEQHCRESVAVSRVISLAPEKSIQVIMQPSRTNTNISAKEASTRDFCESRGMPTMQKKSTHANLSNSPNKRKRIRGTRRNQKRPNRPTTRAERAKRQRLEEPSKCLEDTIEQYMDAVCGDVQIRIVKKQILEEYHARHCANEENCQCELKNFKL